MYDILDSRLTDSVRPAAVAGLDTALRNIQGDIDRYIQWKNRDVTAVAPDHLLVSLLTILGSKVGWNPEFSVNDIYQRTHHLAGDVSRTFGFTHSGNAGRLHIGDSGNTTLYLVGESPNREGVSWRTPYWEIVPVRYISHDSTNFTMGSPALSEEGFGLGFDVIEIDLGLLVIQYYLWASEQLAMSTDSKRNLQHFISMYTLPGLKRSQYGLAFMNRMSAYAEDHDPDNTFYRTSMALPDRTRQMETACVQLTNIILKKDVTFEYLLEAIPVPCSPNLGALNTIPDLPPTRQVTWALLLARYNLTSFLFNLSRMEPDRARRYPVNGIVRAINRVISDRGFSQGLGLREQRDVIKKLNSLIQMTEA